jgi:hypothetical protein
VVKQGGSDFDFGQAAAMRPADTKTARTEQIQQIHERAAKASDIVKDWLNQNISEYERLTGMIKDAEKALKIGPFPSTKALAVHLAAADKAVARAVAKVPKPKVPVLVTTADGAPVTPPPSPPKLPEEEQRDIIAKAIADIEADNNLSRIEILHEEFEDAAYFRAWLKKGVLSMPLEICLALAVSADLRWGEEYVSSKDGMHFERMGLKNRNYIQADLPLRPKEPARTLEQLLKEAMRLG